MLVAGDIGGTKTRLALFSDKDPYAPFLYHQTFISHESPNLESIVSQYLEKIPPQDRSQIKGGCFAVAGPVRDGICKATNLPWIIDAKKLSSALNLSRVFLINDLEANATSVEILSTDQLYVLNAGNPLPRGNRSVVSPGTGLGEAGLLWNGNRYLSFASEGGHAEFGPRNALQLELSSYLISRFGHPSYERILSGPGIYTLYQFLVDVKKHTPSAAVAEAISKKTDPAIVISQQGLSKESVVCSEVLELFVSVLGSEAGNSALKWLAYGGVYLGGGISPKILPKLQEPTFMAGFSDKGRFASLLKEVPVTVILDEKASIKGAAHFFRLEQ